MLNIFARSSVSRVTDPIGAWLLRRGVTPDLVTVSGTAGTVVSALWFFPQGQLLSATLVISAFVMFDLLDGAVARARGYGTRFGTVLDATCDRLADGALFAGLTWWCFGVGDRRELAVAALICLVTAQVISYIKARAEATGLSAGGGVMERAERYLVTLVGTGLTGIGVSWAIDLALWLVAALSLVTIGQRVAAVWHSAKEVT
ncbi:MAG: CDP-alcohol phosphatidyltransferase family protein [Pseudonocardiaceae bacterium]|nr:CDP-alcohol phosphatidyltransferase family protein [Pseudonocardiaceae bacterium]